MNKEITSLQPNIVWKYFDEITRIPRPSKHEGKMIAYLKSFADEHSLEYKMDSIGNVVIYKKATFGMEFAPCVVLQGHMDMVCEKNSDVVFDFDNDPIQTVIDGDWVKARGTTLGADCGIGMAAQLAVLASDDIAHGPIEALFTVDEETGLTGAFGLAENMISGKYLINLDSEDEGEIFIGCAGGIDTIATILYKKESVPDDHVVYKMTLSGLTGGHSGDDIEKGYANSNKLLNRFLWQNQNSLSLRLVCFDGGNLRNAIPREASAVFAIPKCKEVEIRLIFDDFCKKVTNEYKFIEKKIAFNLALTTTDFVIDLTAQKSLIYSIQAVANGVLQMSRSMPNLVETSTNLASVKFQGVDTILITTSQRSSVESAKYDAMATVESCFMLAGATVIHSDGYPGWEPNVSSNLLKISANCYEKLFGLAPKIRAIHAGLECGLFLKKYPNLEMISFGPTLRGVHSPDERMEIKTVEKFWVFLKEILVSVL